MVQPPHQQQQSRTEDVLSELDSFEQLQLPSHILSALKAAGFVRPSPVQQHAIPIAALGLDALVQSKSGTGKTLVYTIAILLRVDPALPIPQGAEVLCSLTTHLPAHKGKVIVPGVFIGGLPIEDDHHLLRRTCHVALGTPGRLCALLHQGMLPTGCLRLLVLDEADKLLLESSLADDVAWIASLMPGASIGAGATTGASTTGASTTGASTTGASTQSTNEPEEPPTRCQVLALSATFAPPVKARVSALMHWPQYVLESPQNASLLGVAQRYVVLPFDDGADDATRRDVWRAWLLQLLSSLMFTQAVVFCNKKDDAAWLADQLHGAGYAAVYIAGGQAQDVRIDALYALREFRLRVVVTTDLVARGVDLERVNLVVNLDLPPDPATYLHRVGRSGRFGGRGLAIACLRGEQQLQTLQGWLAELGPGTLLQPLPSSVDPSLYCQPLEDDADQDALVCFRAQEAAAVAGVCEPSGCRDCVQGEPHRTQQPADVDHNDRDGRALCAHGDGPWDRPQGAESQVNNYQQKHQLEAELESESPQAAACEDPVEPPVEPWDPCGPSLQGELLPEEWLDNPWGPGPLPSAGHPLAPGPAHRDQPPPPLDALPVYKFEESVVEWQEQSDIEKDAPQEASATCASPACTCDTTHAHPFFCRDLFGWFGTTAAAVKAQRSQQWEGQQASIEEWAAYYASTHPVQHSPQPSPRTSGSPLGLVPVPEALLTRYVSLEWQDWATRYQAWAAATAGGHASPSMAGAGEAEQAAWSPGEAGELGSTRVDDIVPAMMRLNVEESYDGSTWSVQL